MPSPAPQLTPAEMAAVIKRGREAERQRQENERERTAGQNNIVRFPGCGVFESNFSWMLRDKRSGALAGMVLCSRVGGKVAHITQLCIAQAYRGRGVGHGLLLRTAQSLLRAGFEAITLTVTEANEPAVRVYERFGFTLRHRFDAMVMESQFKPF